MTRGREIEDQTENLTEFHVVSGFGFITPMAGQRGKERNPYSYRDAAASLRTLREILKPGH